MSLRVPNDCSIVALRAYSLLDGVAPWVGLLELNYVEEKEARAHMVTVFDLGGVVYYHDYGGALELPKARRDSLTSVVSAIAKREKTWTKVKGRWAKKSW